MWEASGRRALRTSMGGLRGRGSQRRNPFRGFFQRLAYARPRRSADHIVAIERGVQRNSRIEIFPKFVAELAELFQRQLTEFHAFADSQAHRIPDLFVRLPKGNT